MSLVRIIAVHWPLQATIMKTVICVSLGVTVRYETRVRSLQSVRYRSCLKPRT